MWWWLSCGGGCHVVVIVMWWWFSCKIKHGNGDRCWLYRACWWLSCGGGRHVVLIVIGTGCHVVVEVIGNDCPGSGWLLTAHPWSQQIDSSRKPFLAPRMAWALWKASWSSGSISMSWGGQPVAAANVFSWGVDQWPRWSGIDQGDRQKIKMTPNRKLNLQIKSE